jgi:hypothetical protein
MSEDATRTGRRALTRAAAGLVLAALVFMAGCTGGLEPRLVRPPVSGKPYLTFYGRVEGFDVWFVNGQYVRENFDEEFTNFGQHLKFPFIPAREFWLDEENAPGEARFFIDHLLVENRLMARGVTYINALDEGDKVEKTERLGTAAGREGAALAAAHRTGELMARIHKKLLEEWSDGVKVWVVDGELIRDVFYIDFTEGGHDKVYGFIPAKEVWIDDDVKPEERPFIVLHELHERALMSRGWTYAKAHPDSSRIEFHYRRHPAGLDAALRVEMAKNRS